MKINNLILKKFDKFKPQFAIITGSGVKVFPNNKPLLEIRYEDLWQTGLISSKPKSLKTSVIGHESKLKLFKIKKKYILVFSGRKHLYQGYSVFDVIANIKIASKIGVKKVLITNAAGGLNPKFKAGDLMLITGYIDLMQPTERGVLSGIIQEPKSIKENLTLKINKRKVQKGIYAGVIGPTYETYSEVNLLKKLKASAVGMSTIPELIACKSFGLDFAGISIISNVWDKKHKPSHKEVVRQVEIANRKLNDLILQII